MPLKPPAELASPLQESKVLTKSHSEEFSPCTSAPRLSGEEPTRPTLSASLPTLISTASPRSTTPTELSLTLMCRTPTTRIRLTANSLDFTEPTETPFRRLPPKTEQVQVVIEILALSNRDRIHSRRKTSLSNSSLYNNDICQSLATYI